jgi:hypothetical protein
MGLLLDLMVVPGWALLKAAMSPALSGPWLEDSL